MAIQTYNVYRCTVYQASLIAMGQQMGTSVVIMAADPVGVQATLVDMFGTDIVKVVGPTCVIQNVTWDTVAGPTKASDSAHDPSQPPAAPPPTTAKPGPVPAAKKAA